MIVFCSTEIDLEYSLDMGKSWQLLYDWCLPSDMDCISYHGNSTFFSDVFYGWNRVMIPLPHYTRSVCNQFFSGSVIFVFTSFVLLCKINIIKVRYIFHNVAAVN